jgi:hypothetical protein
MKARGLISCAFLLGGVAQLGAQDLSADGRLFGTVSAFAQVLAPSVSDAIAPGEGFSFNQIVRGKPFSATEERRTLQILRDGTRIDNGEKNRLFRDSQGRMRIEGMNGTVTIFDAVTGLRVQLDPVTKTARREIPAPAAPPILGAKAQPNSKSVAPETTVNLKAQVVNGVMAEGTRTTMIIPKRQIGNDREIKVVTERWVSNDLQILIKSTNTDPRYGESTYQLTGIVQKEPDPALFQIPADYAVVPEGGRGGRNPGGRSGPPVPGGRSPVPGGRGLPGTGGGRSQDPQGTK